MKKNYDFFENFFWNHKWSEDIGMEVRDGLKPEVLILMILIVSVILFKL